MFQKFARAPLALAVSFLLSQSAMAAALLEPVDLSLPSGHGKAAATDAPRLRMPMRPMPAAWDLAKIGAEGMAREHLNQLLRRSELSKSAHEAFELHSVSPLRNGASVVQFKRRVDGIEVFREGVGMLLDGQSRLVAFRGRDALLSNSSSKALAAFTLSDLDAATRALSAYGFDTALTATQLRSGQNQGDYRWFDAPTVMRSASGAENHRRVRVKPVYFPHATQGLIPAYYVETQVQPDARSDADYYAHVISAVDGSVLFRHNQESDVAFSYTVWAEQTAEGWPQPSPYGRNDVPNQTGLPPGPLPSFAAPVPVSIQNKPFSENDAWLPNGATVTTGNNADAYVDVAGADGFTPATADQRAATTSANTFNYVYDVGAAPGSVNQRHAASVMQFYWVNWLHDDYYDAGFDEASGNAQTDNFGRGGLGGDAINAEGQDSSGTSNANMATPADGDKPRMQMYVFTPTNYAQTTVNPAPGVQGYVVGTAAFGPTNFNINDDFVRAVPNDACAALTNGAAVSGKVAFIDRSASCTFPVQVKNAQNAGAVAAIVGSMTSGQVAFAMTGSDATITIPSLSLGFDNAQTVRTELSGGSDTISMRRLAGINRDGTIDGSVIAHEWGHYISNRLIGDASGLSNNQGGSMGEGWGDFHMMLSVVREADRAGGPTPDFSDLYVISSYAFGNLYYGFRRYPYTTQLSKNPLMFRHIANGTALPGSPTPRFGASGASNSEVHNTGEVWTAALWECYAGLLNASTPAEFDAVRTKMKEYVVAGYKLTPSAPTMTEARDAILAAVYAQDVDDFEICAAGFAKRGMGLLAVSPPRDSATHVGVVENSQIGGNISVVAAEADDGTSCDNDGYLDINEEGTVEFDVRNTGWTSLAGGSVAVTSSHAGVNFSSGASAPLTASVPFTTQTVTLPVTLTSAPGSGVVSFTATPTEGTILMPPGDAMTVHARVNTNEAPAQTATEQFDTRNFGWTTAVADGANANFEWTRSVMDATGNRNAIGPDTGGIGTTSLVTMPIAVGAGAFSITLNHRYSFEADSLFWDGGVIEVSDDGGANWDSVGGATYNGTINGDLAAGNPLHNMAAYVGNSTGYPAAKTDVINLGTTYANQNVLIRFRIGTDAAVGGPGWELNSVALSGAGTPFANFVPQSPACASSLVFSDGFE